MELEAAGYLFLLEGGAHSGQEINFCIFLIRNLMTWSRYCFFCGRKIWRIRGLEDTAPARFGVFPVQDVTSDWIISSSALLASLASLSSRDFWRSSQNSASIPRSAQAAGRYRGRRRCARAARHTRILRTIRRFSSLCVHPRV